MKRKIKKYSKPKRPFDKERIEEEAEIKKKFGLKNKKEIWKADSKVKSFREKAKKLIPASKEEQEALFNRLKKMGFEVNSIADVLSMDKKDLLERRLQSILVKKNLATTSKGARQLITHKKVLVDGRVVNIPSYLVPLDLEDKIVVKKKVKKVPEKKEVKEKPEEDKDKSQDTEKGDTEKDQTKNEGEEK
ncbi:MAG: 30S ribosomal protein S4 [Candidatus Pacearchaeota archaeon]